MEKVGPSNVGARALRMVGIGSAWVLGLFLVVSGLALGSVVGTIAAGAAIVLLAPGPHREWLEQKGLSSRRRWAAFCALGFTSMMLIGAAAPPPANDPQTSAPSAAPATHTGASKNSNTAAPVQDEAARVAGEKAERTQAMRAAYLGMLELTAPCDKAVGSVGTIAAAVGNGRATTIDLYAAAKSGQERCQAAWLGVKGIEAPDGLPDEGEAALEAAVETCGSAYFLKQRAMETGMTIADGGAKPSLAVSFQEDLRAAQSGVLQCIAGWFGAAQKSGIDAAALKVD